MDVPLGEEVVADRQIKRRGREKEIQRVASSNGTSVKSKTGRLSNFKMSLLAASLYSTLLTHQIRRYEAHREKINRNFLM